MFLSVLKSTAWFIGTQEHYVVYRDPRALRGLTGMKLFRVLVKFSYYNEQTLKKNGFPAIIGKPFSKYF